MSHIIVLPVLVTSLYLERNILPMIKSRPRPRPAQMSLSMARFSHRRPPLLKVRLPLLGCSHSSQVVHSPPRIQVSLIVIIFLFISRIEPSLSLVDTQGKPAEWGPEVGGAGWDTHEIGA